MTGMLRSMVGSAPPQWPDIPWHITDSAAAVPPELARAVSDERNRCLPLTSLWQVLLFPLARALSMPDSAAPFIRSNPRHVDHHSASGHTGV